MPLLDDLKPFVFGGMASCVAEASTFPIDTAKTRLQLQGQKTEDGDRKPQQRPYRGTLDVWRRVAAEEGATTLYRGLPPALLRQASYGTIKFGLYHTAKELAPMPDSPAKNVLCAVTSGAVASAIANPTDVLKVRLQARDSAATGMTPQGKNTGMMACFADIHRREGVRGLWRGVAPTAQRAAVVAGVQLPVYDASKLFFLRRGMLADGAANHLVSSFCAGLCACLASCPVDVVRTRMMGQRKLRDPPGATTAKKKNFFLSATTSYSLGAAAASSSASSAAKEEPSSSHAFRVYKNSLHCFFTTVRTEGFLALYKGFVPSFMRMGPWNIIFFLVYEQLKREFPPSSGPPPPRR